MVCWRSTDDPAAQAGDRGRAGGGERWRAKAS
jgi:hypothetical protein